MNIYLDASVIVKVYIKESETQAVLELTANTSSKATGLLSRAEVSAALAKAVRVGIVDRKVASEALYRFRKDWSDYICITATNPLIYLADRLAWDYGLRGYDAVHLASAITWKEALGSPVTVATYDKQLWLAARTVALDVWPDQLN
ncbi:MAG TPA: type II toxin-antitoxin system VapC family toxin [Anaerolineae bacterium]